MAGNGALTCLAFRLDATVPHLNHLTVLKTHGSYMLHLGIHLRFVIRDGMLIKLFVSFLTQFEFYF